MRSPSRRLIAQIALFLAVSALVGLAHAERCGDAARAWVARCAQASGIAIELESCPASVAILSTKEVRVEVSTSPSAYEHAGGYGLSPIGDFADWKLEPEPRRRAFDAIVSCVARDPPEALLPHDAPAPAAPVPPRARIPWLLAFGVALALSACTWPLRRANLRNTGLALLAIAATFALGRWLTPFTFFHQNGQGPMWVGYAFWGDAGEYGPGYPEVFGLVAHVRRPEHGIALLQELMAATMPLSAYAIARASGAAKRTALVFGVVLALDPVLLRIAHSESYFSAIVALLLAAGAVLATTDRRHRALGLVAAALLVAQAARIHPLAWVPCALVPLVLFCRPGRPLDRAKRAALAAAVIGLVTAPLVIATMKTSLAGHLGHEFLPGARTLLVRRGLFSAAALAPLAALAAMPSTRRIGTRALVLGLVVATAVITDMLKGDAEVVRAAHLHLYLPALLAAAAAVRVRSVSLAIAALATVHFAFERPKLVLPTDARELGWALDWREDLPRNAEVASLGRADQRLLALPLLGADLPAWRPIDEGGRALFEGGPRYWYRSSLCSTPEGAPICARFERDHSLRPIATRRFPAIASLPWATLPPGEIEVGLYAVDSKE
jgi:hypothetical protein